VAPERSRRRWLVTALVVAGTVFAILSIHALWANRQFLNTENWTETSSELLESEHIREAVGGFLVDQAYSRLDVEEQLRQVLPPRAEPLAGPAAGGLRDLADRGMQDLLQRPRFQTLWENANREAHRDLLAVLEGGSDALATEGGAVTLDLGALLEQAAQELGIGGRLAARIPPGAVRIEILRSDELAVAQDGFQAFRGLTVVFVLLTLGCYVLAVVVAGRRREALRSVGIGLVVAGVVALVVREVAGTELVNALAETAAVRPAVEDTWTIGTSLLVEAAVSSIAYGAVIVAAAWLAGPTRAAVRTRAALAPYLREPRIAYAALALVFLVIVLWGPTPATRKPIPLVLLALLLVLGLEALRRQVARSARTASSSAP
jgi:hypothetical protein